MNNQYTEAAEKALELAGRAAVYHRQIYIGTEHLLIGLLKAEEGAAARILTECGVIPEKLENIVDRLIAPQGGAVAEDRPGFSPRAEVVLRKAGQLAEKMKIPKTGTEHILLAMLANRDCIAVRLLHTMGVDLRKLQVDAFSVIKTAGDIDDAFLKSMAGGSGSRGATPVLDQYSRDLTAMAAEGKLDPVIGRQTEILRVMQILSRRTKNNPCLIGEPGVGKTAIVEGLALRISRGEVPEIMKNRRVVVLDLSGMVAGTKFRGEFEERIRSVIREVSSNRNILLFIDELHTLIGAGGAEGSLDASNILKPSLSRGEIQVIGATTVDEYRKHIEKDAALERLFQPVNVEEPDTEESIEILRGLKQYYEQHHGVSISDQALRAAVELSERYINDRRLPDKAIDLIDEAAARLKIGVLPETVPIPEEEKRLAEVASEKEQAILEGDFRKAGKLQEEQEKLSAKAQKKQQKEIKKQEKEAVPTVTEETVAEAVAAWTRIPVAKIAEAESKKLARLEKELHKRVIGQDEAVQAVAGAIRRGRVGLKDPGRPTGSFLFLGPTGVGKTELSKAVAETVFGSEQNMIRVDMSEYMEKHSVSKMIGSPPGYVGHEDGGQLSEQVRRHPYSVVLFDEIEKAHPDVFNVLLQVLDEGHITDSHGRRVDFKNTCIIMTSNAGAKAIVDPKRLGFMSQADEERDYEAMKSGVMDEVKRIFRPEFLNRIDEIIVFRTLNEKQVEQIVGLLFDTLKERAQKQMDIQLKMTPSVRRHIASKGFSPKFGARPLRREIQTCIENPLSEMVLKGELKKGDTVAAGLVDGEIRLTVEKKHSEKKKAK